MRIAPFLLAAAACAPASKHAGFDDAKAIDTGAGSDATTTVLDGCVLHMKMDEAAWSGVPGEVIDSCGANSGTALNGATTTSDPLRGTVGIFSGGTSCIHVPDAPSLHMTDAFTISAWIQPTMLSAQGFGVVSKRVDYMADNEYSVFIWAQNDGAGSANVLYTDIDTETDRGADPTTLYANGDWHQITVVYNGMLTASQRIRYYIDGALTYVQQEASATIATQATEPDLSVGCLPVGGPGQAFVGSLDEVVIWNRSLTAADATSWYAATVKH